MSSNAEAPDDLIDTATAAALIGRHVATVRRDVYTGRLAGWMVRRRLMVSRRDVEASAAPVRVRPEGGAA